MRDPRLHYYKRRSGATFLNTDIK